MGDRDNRLQAGTIIREWRVEEFIGAGGFADVYAVAWVGAIPAALRQMPERCALKVIRDGDGADLDWFIREAAIGFQARGPHLIQTFDAFLHDGRPLLVMELADTSLRALLKRSGPLSRAEMISLPGMLRQVLPNCMVNAEYTTTLRLTMCCASTAPGSWGTSVSA